MSSLSAYPNITDLLQGEHSEILAGLPELGWGTEKVAFGVAYKPHTISN